VQKPDWLADETVRIELLSAVDSLIIRENTGNFAILGLLRPALAGEKPRDYSGLQQNSSAACCGGAPRFSPVPVDPRGGLPVTSYWH